MEPDAGAVTGHRTTVVHTRHFNEAERVQAVRRSRQQGGRLRTVRCGHDRSNDHGEQQHEGIR